MKTADITVLTFGGFSSPRENRWVAGIHWQIVQSAGGALATGIGIENPFLNRHSHNVRAASPAAQSPSLLSRGRFR